MKSHAMSPSASKAASLKLRKELPGKIPGAAGFTLVELLVVLSIMSLLIALLLPALASSRRVARSLQCSSNIRQWGIAFNGYFVDNKDYFPRDYFLNASSKQFLWIQFISPYMGVNLAHPSNLVVNISRTALPHCPDIANWQEPGTYYSYGYNVAAFSPFGSAATLTFPRSAISYSGVADVRDGVPARLHLVSGHTQTALLAESCQNNNMATQRSSGYWATGNGRVSFRHQKKAHTLYLDGHAKPEGQELLYKAHKAGFPWNVTLKATKSWEDTTAAAWTDDRYDPYR